MARGGRTAPRVDPRLDPTLRVGAGEAPDGEVCATADETDQAGCKPPAGDALAPGCAAVAEPSAAARMNCDARVDESSARRAEALRVAFAQGSSVWLLEDGMEPDNLLPSQLLIHGRELFVSKSLCVLARFPFLLSLRRWLCQLYRHSLSPSGASLEQLIANLLWATPIPPLGHISVCLQMGGEAIDFWRPAPAQQLPLTQLPLSALLYSLPSPALLRLVQAAIMENKILLVSKHLSKLTAAAEALCAFLWPMRWQGVYIPLLPAVMCEIMQSPVPFIIGVHTDAFIHASSMALVSPDVVVAKLDDGELCVPPELPTPPALPEEPTILAALQRFALSAASISTSCSYQPFESRLWREETEATDLEGVPHEPLDLAFPMRALRFGAAEEEEAARLERQLALRHAFASSFARLLRGYDSFLRLTPQPEHVGLERVLDTHALLESRTTAAEKKLLSALLQTQAVARLIEQRAGYSSRDAELALFDALTHRCAAASATPPATSTQPHANAPPPPPPLPAEPIPQDARPLLNADPPRGWPHVAACCEPCEPPVGRAWSLGQGDDS